MPDILIRGMEMSEIKNNHGIKAELRRIDGRLEIGFMTGGYSCCEQWTYYPIHELPPHGDLIEADKLKKLAYDRGKRFECVAFVDPIDIALAPVIVPASEEVANG